MAFCSVRCTVARGKPVIMPMIVATMDRWGRIDRPSGQAYGKGWVVGRPSESNS